MTVTRLRVRDVMTRGVVPAGPAIGANADLADAVELMLELAVDELGVVDRRGRPVGALTWADVAVRAERRGPR